MGQGSKCGYANVGQSTMLIIIIIIRELIPTRSDFGITGECLKECDQLRERCLAVTLEPVRGAGKEIIPF